MVRDRWGEWVTDGENGGQRGEWVTRFCMGDEILCVCLVPRECNPLEYDEGARDERKVFWHSERELEEDLIKLARDGGELRTALGGPLTDSGPLTD